MANNGKKLKKNDKKPQAKRVRVSKKEYDEARNDLRNICSMYSNLMLRSIKQEEEIKTMTEWRDEAYRSCGEYVGKYYSAIFQSNLNWRIAVYSFAGLILQTIIALNAIL